MELQDISHQETLSYSCVIIEGRCKGQLNIQGVAASCAALCNGAFKAVVELNEGDNDVVFSDGVETRTLRLTYAPPQSQSGIRVVYLTAKDGDTSYQTFCGDKAIPHTERIRTGLALLQAVTAEDMRRCGYGRMTFGYRRTANGQIRVDACPLPLRREELRQITDDALASLLKPFLTEHVLFIQNWTDVASDGVKHGHAAFGKPGYAIHSTWGLHTWPSGIDDTMHAFTNCSTRGVSPADKYNKYWEILSNHLSGVLHEMGHSFGLFQSSAVKGACPVNPLMKSAAMKVLPFFCPDDTRLDKTAHNCDRQHRSLLWGRTQSLWLSRHALFTGAHATSTFNPNVIPDSQFVTIESATDLALLTVCRKDKMAHENVNVIETIAPATKRLRLSKTGLLSKVHGPPATVQVRVMDCMGRVNSNRIEITG